MIRRWLWPVIVGLVVAAITWQVTLTRAPRFLMSAAYKRLSSDGMVNVFRHVPLATDESRAVVRPSPDLAYSSCAFDLRAGPVAIIVPPLPTRYWSLSVFKGNTDVAFVRNNVETGGQAIRLALALEDQAVPEGVEVVRLPDARGVALIRALVEDRAASPTLDAARKNASCRRLTG